MLGLLISAVVMMVVIAAFEDDHPDWMTAIACVVATSGPTAILNYFLPSGLFFVGPIVGAIVGGVVISALFGMGLKRASMAAGIYLLCSSVLSFVF